MADSVTPLCSVQGFTSGAFADLLQSFSGQAVTDLMSEATRICEDITERRLAPFTVTEMCRADGGDPDEMTGGSNIPMSFQGSLGTSYARALGTSSLVRHCWLSEFAPRYPDLWTYSGVSVSILTSYGGSEAVPVNQLLSGPEPDSGHVWFGLGTYLPVGSRIAVTYSGGYTVATPASLSRASKFIGAYLALRELAPDSSNHDPDQLWADALKLLEPYSRD